MEIFNNRQRSGYKEIVSYGPRWWTEYLEMDTNYKFAGWTLDLMAYWLERIVNNQFPRYADEDTIRMLERLLKIEYEEDATLEERRRIVAMYLSGLGRKICRSVIKALVKAYTEQDCDVYWDGERLVIAFKNDNGVIVRLSVLLNILRRKLPAHIDWQVRCIKTAYLGISAKKDPWPMSFVQAGTRPKTNIGLNIEKPTVEIHAAGKRWRTYPPLSGASGNAGTYPNTSTGLEIRPGTLTIETQADGYKHSSPMAGISGNAGTYPDTSMGLRISDAEINLQADGREFEVQHIQTGTRPGTNTGLCLDAADIKISHKQEIYHYQNDAAGTLPDVNVGLGKSSPVLSVKAEKHPYTVESQAAGESGNAGTYPDTSTGLELKPGALTIEAQSDSYKSSSPMTGASGETGTIPETSMSADINNGSVGPEVSTETWQVDYALCGEDL